MASQLIPGRGVEISHWEEKRGKKKTRASPYRNGLPFSWKDLETRESVAEWCVQRRELWGRCHRDLRVVRALQCPGKECGLHPESRDSFWRLLSRGGTVRS